MTLHTIGPQSMIEDEHKIGRAYQTWLGPLYLLAPFAVAAYAPDVKWLVAAGFAGVLANLHECGGRLHDLCIRVRRTNILISDQISSAASRNHVPNNLHG